MTQKLANAQYDAFSAYRRRTSCNGLAGMPVAAAFPTPAVVVALNGGFETDYITFGAVRRGMPPYVPAPYTTNKNRVYMAGSQCAAFPVQDPGGIEYYVVAGWYSWLILAPEGLESEFMIGNLPFPGVDKDERIPTAYFAYDLINQRISRRVDGVPIPTLPDEIKDILALQLRGG